MGERFSPGDPIGDGEGAALHRVSDSLPPKLGRVGVILSKADGGGYAVWLVDVHGRARRTMTTGDVIAAGAAFAARVAAALRMDGKGGA